MFGPGHRLLIAQFVGLVPFPLYGPIDNPLGLVLTSTGWSGRSSDDIGSLDLSFRRPRFPDTSAGHTLTIRTSRAHQHGIEPPPDNDERFLRHLDASIFPSSRLNDSPQEQAGQPAIWRGELLIDTDTFTGSIRSWSQPYQLARFPRKNEQTILSGHTCGPSRDELLQLLAHLHLLNQHEETLAQYQRELDETRAQSSKRSEK